VGAGGDTAGGDLGAVGQGDAAHPAVAGEDACHRGVGADLGPVLFGGDGDGVGDAAHAAADVAPDAAAPSHSPMTWWNRTYAVPGIDGDAITPMTASVAKVTFSCSDSNQRSRIGRAALVSTSIAFTASVPSLRKFQP